MSVVDYLASLLLTAERASSEGAVTIDMFPRNDASPSGELSTFWEGAAPVGRIVAERGRVCWVMAKGCEATVSDLLAAETGIPRQQLEDVYQAAKTDGSPFCETVANAGLVSPDEVRRTLRRQAAEALLMLAHIQSKDPVTVSVARIPRLRYDERFTFAALEILEAAIAGSKQLQERLGALPATYARMAPQLEAALCFRESNEADLSLVPIACRPPANLSLGGALDLSLAGLQATQPDDPVGAEIAPFALVAREASEWWLCAYAPPHLCLFQLNSRAEYLEIVAGLVAEQR